MGPQELLQACAVLNHNDRMRRMVEFGQQAAGDASIQEALAQLAQGETYQRFLVLQSCYGSRDSARVIQALSDPSRLIRGRALGLAALVCSDAELPGVFAALPLD